MHTKMSSAARRGASGNSGKESRAHSTDRITLGFITADICPTPWWSLQVYKAALINIAGYVGVDMYIFSRPPLELETDPYFQSLDHDGLCTIVNFDSLESSDWTAIALWLTQSGKRMCESLLIWG